MKKLMSLMVVFLAVVTLYKGVSLPSFPNQFTGESGTAFAVLSTDGAHARNNVITVTFDMYASEVAYDAKKPKMQSYSYTITEIYDGTEVNSMTEFFNMLYNVVIANDPKFSGATPVLKTENK